MEPEVLAFPEELGLVVGLGSPASKNEKVIAQAVDVGKAAIKRFGLEGAKSDQHSLGSTTHCPRLVKKGAHRTSAWQDEFLQRRKFFIEVVDPRFHLLDVRGRDALHALPAVTRQRGEIGPKTEKLVLNHLEHVIDPRHNNVTCIGTAVECPREAHN